MNAQVVSALAGSINALLLLGLIYFAWKQLDHLRDKEFLDKIRDEKFKFPDDLTGDEMKLAGLFVRLWVLNHKEAITYEQFKQYSVKVQVAIMEVLMAHDRVVHDFALGLSKRTVVRYQGSEFKHLWRIMEKVVKQLRKEQGPATFCITSQRFVESQQFSKLYDKYYKKAHGKELVE
jgi:hypothetical protein